MDPSHNLLFVAFLLFVCLPVIRVTGYATVTGTVYCDQCKDGERSWSDFPVSGVKVSVTCADGNGQVYMSREEITNWLGGYVMRFDGTPDLSNCYAQVSDNGAQQQGSSSCSIGSGPAQKLRLIFSLFGIEMFAADALLSQPVQPMSSCPKPPAAPITPPPHAPVMPLPPVPVIPPPAPVIPPPSQVPVVSPPPSPPQFKLPPLPPMPFVEPSACSHQ